MTEPIETQSKPASGMGSQLKYLWESWYCAGWSADLTDQPTAITMLDQELVLSATNVAQRARSRTAVHTDSPRYHAGKWWAE